MVWLKLVYKEHNLKSIHNYIHQHSTAVQLKLVYKEHNLKSIHNKLHNWNLLLIVEISI